jgi:uncharacterized cofD-like protein
LPNLLVEHVAVAIGEASARKIFITNLMTQPGETDGYDLQRHLDTMTQYAPQIRFDRVIVNNRAISSKQAELYSADGAYQIALDADAVVNEGVEIVRADLLDEGEMVRHNSERLARAVIACSENARMQIPVGVEALFAEQKQEKTQ